MSFQTDLGARITALCRKNGLTQTALARQMHVSSQAVSKWQRGESMPDLERAAQLAALLHVSIDYLITGYNAQAAPVGKRTGLSQESLDFLRVWNTSRELPGFFDYLLTRSAAISRGRYYGFDRILVNADAAVRLMKERRRALAASDSPVPIDPPGQILPPEDVADGLIHQSGAIFSSLVSEYIASQVRKME